jgi:hypothetical protein
VNNHRLKPVASGYRHQSKLTKRRAGGAEVICVRNWFVPEPYKQRPTINARDVFLRKGTLRQFQEDWHNPVRQFPFDISGAEALIKQKTTK